MQGIMLLMNRVPHTCIIIVTKKQRDQIPSMRPYLQSHELTFQMTNSVSNAKSNLMLNADWAQPRACRNFCQRRTEALQMINCRTCFAAQQISKSVLHSHENNTDTTGISFDLHADVAFTNTV